MDKPIKNDGGTVLTFKMHQFHNAAEHTLGRFRISATTAKGKIPLGQPESLAAVLATLDALDADFADALQRAAALIRADEWGKGTEAGDAIEKLATGPLNGARRRALEVALLDIVDHEGASQRARYVALRTLGLVAAAIGVPGIPIIVAATAPPYDPP